jgi:hypothetical protein
VVLIPAGEKQWHGATEESEFSHIYVTGRGDKVTQFEYWDPLQSRVVQDGYPDSFRPDRPLHKEEDNSDAGESYVEEDDFSKYEMILPCQLRD